MLQHKPSRTTTQAVRACRREDLTNVVDLFAQVFLEDTTADLDDLHGYFERIYFDNPWACEEIPSLVLETEGVLQGFLGVIPRRMRFHGEQIRVAVGSALMVRSDDAGLRNPLVAVRLLGQFLEGVQDLSLTDTANDATRSIWTASGGAIAFPYSYSWTRPLRPLSTVLQMGVDSSRLQSWTQPFCTLADKILQRFGPITPKRPESHLKAMEPQDLLDSITSFPTRSLVPDYDLCSLEWLLDSAALSETEGELVARSVQNGEGRQLGWFVYYRNQHHFGRVLQIAAAPRSMPSVLDSLLFDASSYGLAALWGRTDPEHASLLSQRGCIFQAKPTVLVHSSRPEIIASFQEADVFFSGFEGELWMKTNA